MSGPRGLCPIRITLSEVGFWWHAEVQLWDGSWEDVRTRNSRMDIRSFTTPGRAIRAAHQYAAAIGSRAGPTRRPPPP